LSNEKKMKPDEHKIFEILVIVNNYFKNSDFKEQEYFAALCAFVIMTGCQIGIDKPNFIQLVIDWYDRFTREEVIKDFFSMD